MQSATNSVCPVSGLRVEAAVSPVSAVAIPSLSVSLACMWYLKLAAQPVLTTALVGLRGVAQ